MHTCRKTAAPESQNILGDVSEQAGPRGGYILEVPLVHRLHLISFTREQPHTRSLLCASVHPGNPFSDLF